MKRPLDKPNRLGPWYHDWLRLLATLALASIAIAAYWQLLPLVVTAMLANQRL